jgi:hypothetical protein
MMPDQLCSLDLVSAQLIDVCRFRVLTLLDDCTPKCHALIAYTSLSGPILTVAPTVGLLAR